MSYKLFIDDERLPPSRGDWLIACNWEDVQMHLRREGMPSYISFDHDLGLDSLDGYEIAKRLVDLDMSNKDDGDIDLTFPEDFAFYVHSQNPIGKINIESYLDSYLALRKINNGI